MSSPKLNRFNFFLKIELEDGVQITSIAVTDDNHLLICNYERIKLLVYSDRGEYLHDCTLSGKPWGIAIIPGEDKAVVSLPYQKSIQFVSLQSMKASATHPVPGECYGIAVVGDKVCVGGTDGQMYILSKQGKYTNTISVYGFIRINYLHPGQQDSVYYTDYHKKKVVCFKISGGESFTSTTENFMGPSALTTDRIGNLYIACRDSNNIHRFSPDGNAIDIILEHDDNIIQPCGLAFSNNYRYLFVTNDDGKSIFAFSCT